MPVDPRTGRIVFKTTRPAPRAASPVFTAKQLAAALLEILPLEELARVVGKTIAEEMNKRQAAAPQIDVWQPSKYPEFDYCGDGVHPSFLKAQEEARIITIDEQVVDVGIGEVKELKRGEDSSNIGDVDTQQDSSLSDSKSKLKRLKKP